MPESTPLALKTRKALELDVPAFGLLCIPSGYVDCRKVITRLAEARPGETGLFLLRRNGHISAKDSAKRPVNPPAPFASLYEAPWKGCWERIRMIQVTLIDEDGRQVIMSVFGAWTVRKQDPHGAVLVHGELKDFGPDTYLFKPEVINLGACGRVMPRYTYPGSTTKEEGVFDVVREALQTHGAADSCVHELVKGTLLSEAQMLAIAKQETGVTFGSMQELLHEMHEPESPERGLMACLAARVIAAKGICNLARRMNERAPHRSAPIPVAQSTLAKLIQSQPETLTADQQSVIELISSAIRSPQPLNSLLSGDVGTGKTLTFAIPAVAAHLSGAKVAIISPTEILANQVHANLARRFPEAAIERVQTGKKIQNPNAILVGTSGLSTAAQKHGYVPNLLIIDEQHKLGTASRQALCGPWTHLIEASATPIPRSLATSLYSGMQVFNLYEAPVQRDIQSHLMDESERSQANQWMKEALVRGARVVIVYPRVEQTASQEVKEPGKETKARSSVLGAYEAIDARFPDKSVALHGKMKPAELSQALDSFRDGSRPIAVSSTVMETGIDVPDIALMVVKDADCFGAAQLHQLRGRLVRNGGHAHFCMMVSDLSQASEDTIERLTTVTENSNGYALAEADMRLRGFGDLAGEAQSGNASTPFRLLRLTLDDLQLAAQD